MTSRRTRSPLLFPVLFAPFFMVILDIFIVNVTAPSLQAELGASESDVQWVVAAYLLTYAISLITGGRLGDVFGRRRLFRIGVAGFTIASALCAAAPAPTAALLALAAFVALERWVSERGGSPLVELRLLEAPSFRIGLLSALILYGVISFFLLLSFYLQGGLGLSAIDSGLAFTPLAAAFAASSIGAPRLGERRREQLPQAGATLAAIGLLATIAVIKGGGGSVSVELLAALVVVGAGMGMAIPGLINLSLRAVPPSDAGAASGMLTTSQQIGNALGVALVGTIFFAALGSRSGAAAYGDALSAAMAVQVVIPLAAAALVTRAPPPALADAEPTPAPADRSP